ncbi:hypothetical protein CsSME_00044367 [Camellia sinensis var. sinensis]
MAMNPIFLFGFTLFFFIGGLDSALVAGRISTIGHGDELNFTDSLVSQGGNFTLGFFTFPITTHSYLGIWYTKDDQLRRVWVANPNNPLRNSSVLTIDNTTGILKITDRGRTVLNIYDQVSSNATATLEDSGNFVLKTENQTLWQSFDHPTDTLLPGMKIGTNLVTGKNWSLTSWFSESIPASGTFKLTWEEPEPLISSGELVIYRDGQRYWTSGLLSYQNFPNMPMLNGPNSAFHHNLLPVSNKEEKYLTYSVYDEPLLMWQLEPEGYIVDSSNLFITPYLFCYGYQSGSNDGCVSHFGLPSCRSRKDTFMQKQARFEGNTVSQRDDNSGLSINDCMEKCWNNCSCVGFTTSNSNGTGCITWTGDLVYQEISGAEGIYVMVHENSPKRKIWVQVVIAMAISLLILLSGYSCYLIRRKYQQREVEKRKRKEYLKELTTSDSFNNANEVEGDGNEGHGLNILGFTTIMEATNNFSNENKLGQGGFGPVYKGKLRDGREIAVKRLSRNSGQGLVEFKNELILISKLQHTNLVRVLGCCIHGEEKMLIYEFMPNKSLDFFIFNPTKKELLDWGKRLNIIDGVAQGLLYLHKYSRMKVIHRDLKANNVLLDENMNAKISDFGMARIFKRNETEATTNRVVGTYGYMSPEYAMDGIFSIKSDVFSFGILILEIVSGRRNTSFYHFDDRSLNLIGYVWDLWKDGTALELKDPSLDGSCATNQLLRIIHVGLLCVQESATDRPTMSDVISMLSNETMVLPAPKQPAFFTGRNVPNMMTSKEGTSKDCSLNNLTISIMEAR